MSFLIWKDKVDQILLQKVGFSSDDLTDWLWRDAFDDSLTPEQAVEAFSFDVGLPDF